MFLNGVATEDGGGLSLNGTTVMSLLYDTFQVISRDMSHCIAT